MFARDTFLFVVLVAYLLGSLPSEIILKTVNNNAKNFLTWEMPGLKHNFLAFLINTLKGVLAVLIARLLIGTPIAMALAGIAVLVGHYWSFLARFRGGTGIGVLFGVLLVFAPSVLPYLIAIWLVLYLSVENKYASYIITTLSMPIILWQVKRFDLYILFGMATALLVSYHLIGEECTRKRRFRQITLVFVITSLITVGFFSRYVYRGFGTQIDMFRHGNPDLPYVAITFDDGPSPAYTPAILDILAEHNVKATFFMIGRHVEMYPDIARRIVAEGHDIGNHTYSHRSLVPLHPDKVMEEIIHCEEIFHSVTGITPVFFRPPRGVYSQAVRDIVTARNYTLCLWTISSQDWREISSRDITTRILSQTIGGDILLFHDSGNIISAEGGSRYNTVHALPQIITGLKEKGLIPVSMQELLIIKGLTHVEEEM